MRGQAATDGPRARRADRVVVAGIVLVALQTCVRAFVVGGSYYWQDDLFHLRLVQELGLSRDFLVRPYNGHLEIGTNLVYGLIGRDPGSSFLPAALVLLTLQVIASCLLLAVLRQLFGRSPWVLVPFAAYLFTPLALVAVTWFAAGLQALPLQIAMLTALLGGIRAYRSGSLGWAAVSVAGTATGLVFWQKAALVLPALVAVLVLVEEAREPWRRALGKVARFWPFLLPHALLVAVYLPFYLSVSGPSTLGPDPAGAVPAAGETVFALLLPGLFGGPWTAAGAGDTVAGDPAVPVAVAVAAVVLGIVAVSIRLRGARAAKAWLLVAGYLAVDLALVQLGRGDNLDLVARDPRYITDALPVIAIGCCAAFHGPRRVPVTARGAPSRARGVLAAAAVSALLAISSLFSASLVLDELQHRRAQDYVADVLRTMDARPDGSVISSRPPVDIAIFGDFDLDDTLRALGHERTFDRPGTAMGIFDGEGVLRPVTLLAPTLSATGPAEGCGWALGATAQQLGVVPQWSGPQVLRFRYAGPAEATLRLTVGEDRQHLTVPAGSGQASFVVTGQQGPATVQVSGAPAGAVCVDDVVVGTPWPEGVPG